MRVGCGICLSVGVVGSWSHWALFDGDSGDTEIIRRLCIIHVLILPGILLALVAVHLGLVWYQKHTQFPGVGRTENNVVGVRIMPQFAAKGGAFFFIVAGIFAIVSGLFEINRIWFFAAFDPCHVSAGPTPEFY
ncbi:cytochrome b N-terminal domain-containing protein, partial [Microbacterium sp. HSID17254]|uniref:cytochrome b N-terminal domain-containing protein n=1 Tax=Microbacterium sp. HSID17254 TaxID=2419509 RepID=UPI001930F86E